MTISNQRNIHPPLFFNNAHLPETDTHKHLRLIFHHSLSWHTHILHLHQKVMTKIGCLRSFSNSSPHHSLLTIDKTNILPIFDYGSIIYDNCSDSDKRLLDKAQLSAAKIILGCLKTTSSSDVLLDLHFKTFNHCRKIPILRYFSKINFRIVPCPFPMNVFRSFSEFVPYTLRHNLDVQIPLFKKSLAFHFFLRKVCSIWNSLPLEIKSSPSHLNFMNCITSSYHVAKHSTLHLWGVNPPLTSVRCMVRPQSIKISIKNLVITVIDQCFNTQTF